MCGRDGCLLPASHAASNTEAPHTKPRPLGPGRKKDNTMTAQYTTEALSTGAARDGHVAVADSPLAFDLAIPVALGGSGQGANPEQLFAAGYAACFHSALQAVARQQKSRIDGSSVSARVTLTHTDAGAFELAVQLKVVIPELDHDTAQQLADAAHQFCPYSNATRGNIPVQITVTDD